MRRPFWPRGRSDFALGLLAVLVVALLVQLAAPRLLDAQGSSRLRFPSGTQSLPGIAFAANPAIGFRYIGSNTTTAQLAELRLNNAGSTFMNFTQAIDAGTASLNISSTGIKWNGGTAFASLGTPAVGTVLYCSDCTIATAPCTGGGTGALAIRVNSGTPAWRCQ